MAENKEPQFNNDESQPETQELTPSPTETKIENQEQVKIVSVNELIPNIKPKNEKEIEYRSTNHFDNAFMPEFMNKLKGLTQNRETLKILIERLKGQILVDLGPADTGGGYLLATSLGCKGYIGVEKFWHRQLLENLESFTQEKIDEQLDELDYFKDYEFSSKTFGASIKPEGRLIPVATVNDDMLLFLKRLPDNSVSILTSGIDSTIIPNESYMRELADEIQRVLNKDGTYMTCVSDVPVRGLERIENTISVKKADSDHIKSAFTIGLGSRSTLLVKK